MLFYEFIGVVNRTSHSSNWTLDNLTVSYCKETICTLYINTYENGVITCEGFLLLNYILYLYTQGRRYWGVWGVTPPQIFKNRVNLGKLRENLGKLREKMYRSLYRLSFLEIK